LRLYPYSTWLGIALMLAVAASTFFVDGLKLTVPAFIAFLLAITIAYWAVRRRRTMLTAGRPTGDLA